MSEIIRTCFLTILVIKERFCEGRTNSHISILADFVNVSNE